MKKEQYKDIDKVFKNFLDDPVNEPGYQENDWDAFEQLLDVKKTGKVVYWRPVLSAVAAMLLVAFGWWMFRPQVVNTKQKPQQQVAANQQKTQQQPLDTQPSENSNAGKTTVQPDAVNKPATVQPQAKQYVAENIVLKRVYPVSKSRLKIPGVAITVNDNLAKIQTDAVPVNETVNAPVYLSAATGPVSFGTTKNNRTPALTAVNILPKTRLFTGDDAKKPVSSFRPLFAISVLASSDINGVSSFKNSSTGTNVGLMFSAQIKKFTLTTGATYSVKPYTLPFSSYNPNSSYKFKYSPESVTADCRMVDIPLNIDYQVYSKNRNKISVGTGVSSYIMTHENYTYNYRNAGVAGPATYAVKKPEQYLFSIVNFQATYQRQINSKIGVSIQPYLKLPLKEIGYSEVKLQTMGVAVGLSWNINSISKPK